MLSQALILKMNYTLSANQKRDSKFNVIYWLINCLPLKLLTVCCLFWVSEQVVWPSSLSRCSESVINSEFQHKRCSLIIMYLIVLYFSHFSWQRLWPQWATLRLLSFQWVAAVLLQPRNEKCGGPWWENHVVQGLYSRVILTAKLRKH